MSYNSNLEDKVISTLTGQASQEELTAMRSWLAGSEANRRKFNEIAAIWTASSAVGRDVDYQPDAAWKWLFRRMNTQKRSHDERNRPDALMTVPDRQIKTQKRNLLFGFSWKKWAAAAAVLVLVFLAGAGAGLLTGKNTATQAALTYTEYTSPYGSKSKVKLPDGSAVWLNAGSTLRYSSDFNVHHREVFLEGEGYFDVMRNDQSPFLVQTSVITIKVLGTAFNVKAYPEESVVETTVERGSIQLIDPLSSSQKTTILRAHQTAVVMKQDQPDVAFKEEAVKTPVQASKPDLIKPVIHTPIADVKVKNNVRTEVSTSWKDTRWVIESEKLSSLAVKLERRFNVRFVFADETLKENIFSGKLEDETLDQVLEAIKLTSPILYKVKNNTVYLSTNKMFNQKI